MPVINVARGQGQDGFVRGGINGSVFAVPVGVNVNVSDAIVTYLGQVGITFATGGVAIDATTITADTTETSDSAPRAEMVPFYSPAGVVKAIGNGSASDKAAFAGAVDAAGLEVRPILGTADIGEITPVFTRLGTPTAPSFSDDFDPVAYRASLAPVAMFWVDNLTGSNENPGTQAQPFRSVQLGIEKAAAAGFAVVKVKGTSSGKPQRYMRTATQARTVDGNAAFNKTYGDAPSMTFSNGSIIIEPWNAGEAYDLISDFALPSWTATSDPNVWASAGSFSVHLFDYKNLSAFREPRRLATFIGTAPNGAAAGIAAVNSAWAASSGNTDISGSGYALGAIARDTTNNVLYLRTFDNRNPNGDTDLVGTTVSAAGLQMTWTTSTGAAYIDGLGHYGSLNGLYFQSGGGYRPLVVMNGVRAGGSGTNGAVAFAGSTGTDGGRFLLHECKAHGGLFDGFNYHQDWIGFELDCVATWNGWNTSNANNGSTVHETAKITRKGGYYLWSQDRSVHDIGTCVSWNLGVTSGTRRAADGTGQSAAFVSGHPVDPDTSTMYLDSCVVFGAAEFRTIAYAGDSLSYTRLAFAATKGPGTGTVRKYVP